MAISPNRLARRSSDDSASVTFHDAASEPVLYPIALEPDYQAYLGPVRAAVRLVARRFRLTSSDENELQSALWIRLLADSGLALRRFHGRAKIETYLVRIAGNLVLDQRSKLWGRWRPSAKATRHGAAAIQLERLIVCNGMSCDVALQCLDGMDPQVPRAVLEDLAASLKPRARRERVSVDALANYPSPEPSPLEVAETHDEARSSVSLSRTLGALVNALEPQDRNLLVWRFFDNRPIVEIARELAVEPRVLYRRCNMLLGRLRESLDAAGFDASSAESVLARVDGTFRFQVNSQPLPRLSNLRRSA
jgi:RNA polymerase sigma factor (sigma-70 family)